MALSLIHFQDDVSFSGTAQPWHSSFSGVNVPAGSLLVAIIMEAGVNSAGGGSLTDDAGNTYTALVAKNPNNATANGFVRIWYCNNCLNLTAGANNFIYTSVGGAGVKVAARWLAFSGQVTPGNPFDAAVTASAAGSSTISTVTSGIPAGANEYFLGVSMILGVNNGNFGNLIAPFNNNVDSLGNSSGEAFYGTDLNAGTTAQTVKSSSISGTAPFAAIAVAIKPSLTQVLTLLAAPGSYAITGASGLLKTARLLKGAAGSYAITGPNAALLAGKAMKLAAGSYAITGASSLGFETHFLKGAAGSYAITGAPATLIATKAMKLAAGIYTITGDDAALNAQCAIKAAIGGYTITGADATLATDRKMALGSGAYVLTGADATFVFNRVIEASPGVYTLTGYPADLRSSDTHLMAAAGVYTMSGAPAELIVVRAAADDDKDHRGERGQSEGRMPPPERRHHAELELFRNLGYARGVAAAAPPPVIAHHNLTTSQHPTSRPVTVPIPPGRHK